MLALSGLSRVIQGGSEASWVSRASQASQASQGLAAAGWGRLRSGAGWQKGCSRCHVSCSCMDSRTVSLTFHTVAMSGLSEANQGREKMHWITSAWALHLQADFLPELLAPWSQPASSPAQAQASQASQASQCLRRNGRHQSASPG